MINPSFAYIIVRDPHVFCFVSLTKFYKFVDLTSVYCRKSLESAF